MFLCAAHLSRALSYRVAIFLAVLLTAGTLRASSVVEPLALDYQAPSPDACPDGAGFREGVAAQLGYDPFTTGGPRQLFAHVEPQGRSFRGVVALRDHDSLVGSKTLTAPSCEELVAAMTLAASLAIDPFHGLRPAKAAPSETPNVTPTSWAEPTAAPVVRPEAPSPDAVPSRRDRAVPQVFIEGGVAGLGPVAGVAAAFGLGAGLRYGPASLDLEGRYLAPSTESAGSGEVRTSTVGVALVPCFHRGILFLCANVFLGALQGAALDIQAPKQDATFFSQAGARLGVAIPVFRTSVEPFVDGLATLTSTEVTFRGAPVWSTRPVELSSGLRVAFPFL